MSQEQQELASAMESQTERGQEIQIGESGQMVPVSEAIKYRKRAQAAEQKVEMLTQQVEQQQQEQAEVQAQIDESKWEMELTQELAKAGVFDVEAALLLAQKKMESSGGKGDDAKRVIEVLRNERPYLFSSGVDEVRATLAGPTIGVQGQGRSGASRLTRVAQQAQESGSRKDMQEYLRLRRSIRR